MPLPAPLKWARKSVPGRSPAPAGRKQYKEQKKGHQKLQQGFGKTQEAELIGLCTPGSAIIKLSHSQVNSKIGTQPLQAAAAKP